MNSDEMFLHSLLSEDKGSQLGIQRSETWQGRVAERSIVRSRAASCGLLRTPAIRQEEVFEGKHVSFKSTVSVHFIPGMEDIGLYSSDIWWSAEDYSSFKNFTIEVLRAHGLKCLREVTATDLKVETSSTNSTQQNSHIEAPKALEKNLDVVKPHVTDVGLSTSDYIPVAGPRRRIFTAKASA